MDGANMTSQPPPRKTAAGAGSLFTDRTKTKGETKLAGLKPVISSYTEDYKPPGQTVQFSLSKKRHPIKTYLNSKWHPLPCGALQERACQTAQAHLLKTAVCKQYQPPLLLIPVTISNNKEKEVVLTMLKALTQDQAPSVKAQFLREETKAAAVYHRVTPGQVSHLKGQDHRVDGSYANEKQLKRLLDKIEREIPSSSDFLETLKLWYPVYQQRVQRKKAHDFRWDCSCFQAIGRPHRNHFIIHPEFVSEILTRKRK